MPSAIAKMMLKTTICSTSPLAIASMIDVGKTWIRIWSHVCAFAATSDFAAESATPTPGLRMLTASRPMTSAIVVAISK